MMARFYPIKQFPNGKEFRFLRSRIRARTRTRVRVYTRLRSRACAREVGKFLQHVLNGLHEFCAVFDELMTATARGVFVLPRTQDNSPPWSAGLAAGISAALRCAASTTT